MTKSVYLNQRRADNTSLTAREADAAILVLTDAANALDRSGSPRGKVDRLRRVVGKLTRARDEVVGRAGGYRLSERGGRCRR